MFVSDACVAGMEPQSPTQAKRQAAFQATKRFCSVFTELKQVTVSPSTETALPLALNASHVTHAHLDRRPRAGVPGHRHPRRRRHRQVICVIAPILPPLILFVIFGLSDGKIGSGTVLHPKCHIHAETGPIVIGAGNIIEEEVTIVNKRPEPLVIGDENIFEVRCYIEGERIGNRNTFEPLAKVLGATKIGNNCVVGTACSTEANEVLPDNTVIYGHERQRRSQSALSSVSTLLQREISLPTVFSSSCWPSDSDQPASSTPGVSARGKLSSGPVCEPVPMAHALQTFPLDRSCQDSTISAALEFIPPHPANFIRRFC
ncbi:uncharacterized protein VTP21DRAFT_4230 [Calcarisporiella thermophila]|uniref:uncharacterized protein n=1 Tax=Calcarisporiella thermophila TaxID=911321 RepID=UPI0037429AFF